MRVPLVKQSQRVTAWWEMIFAGPSLQVLLNSHYRQNLGSTYPTKHEVDSSVKFSLWYDQLQYFMRETSLTRDPIPL